MLRESTPFSKHKRPSGVWNDALASPMYPSTSELFCNLWAPYWTEFLESLLFEAMDECCCRDWKTDCENSTSSKSSFFFWLNQQTHDIYICIMSNATQRD